jgi:FAD/FMN-containing dehydrogenase
VGLDRRELLGRGAAATLGATLLGTFPELPESAWAAPPSGPLKRLARSLDGTLITRGSPRYASAKRLYDTRFDAIRPLAVAYCESVGDVQKCVRWARQNGVRLTARSGGHSYGGYSTVQNGLVVDVSRLDGVKANRAAGTARVGAGAILIDIYDDLWRSRVSIPGGSCPTVGIAGLALGGGAGFSGRKYGLTSDTIRALTIVTADGRARTASPRDHADLYWACRGGGGGNFGIVTGFTFKTHPVSNVSTFSLQWPFSQARDVIRAWQRWAPNQPDGVFSVTNIGASDTVSAAGQFYGTADELRSLLQPLIDTGTPSRVSVVDRTYMSAVFYWGACGGSVQMCRDTPRSTFKAKSAYALRPMSNAGIEAIVRAVEARKASGLGTGGVILDSYGGAINRVPPGATAFFHRRARFSMQFYVYWNHGAPRPVVNANLRWISRFFASVRPYVSRYAYQNYIDPDLAGWLHAYYGGNLRRLTQVKRRYDPGNVFRFRQSIPLRVP